MSKVYRILTPPLFLLVGSFYYIITPPIFFFNDYFGLEFLKGVASKYTDSAASDIYLRTTLDFLLINISFLLGFYIASKIKFNSKFLNRFSDFNLLPKFIFMGFVLVLFTILVNAYQIGFVFFSGYSSYEISILGPLATLCFMCMWFFIYFRANYFLVLFLVSSALLLGAGSRMFFILPALSFVIYRVFENPLVVRKYLLVFCFFIFSMLGVGLWREGQAISVDGLLTILFAEPIFTSFGNFYYFSDGFPALGRPDDVIAAIINFIPSSIYPGKQEVINQITYDSRINNPLGAQSVVINLYKNFGVFYPLFLFSFGVYFGILFKLRWNRFFYSIYIMSLPVILLHFQREGFITVFKILFFNGFLLPLIIVCALAFLLFKNKAALVSN